MEALQEYQARRNFRKTPEPRAGRGKRHRQPIFVVQEHHASRLHYDFRLEADGVLKSWAIPKEPSMDPRVKRLAVNVEDHPLAYAKFEGAIPEGEYGAGEVTIWDRGIYDNLLSEKAVAQTVTKGIESGRLELTLHGKKLRGNFALIRMQGRRFQGRGKDNWLLIKMKDELARPEGHADGKHAAKPKKAARARKSRPQARVLQAKKTGKDDVILTNAGRVMFPDAGITKGDVFDYYRRIAPRLLPYLHDRPVTLERLPEGIEAGAPHFWQKHTPTYYPSWIARIELPTEQGKMVPYTLVNDEATLLYLVNQGALTFHIWFSRIEDLDRPDFVLFDLDLGQADFADAVAIAHELHQILDKEQARAFVKTSGKTGMHVLARWEQEGGYERARAWCQMMARRVAERLPEQATTEIRKAKRGRRVYIDTLQNARGHHAVPPYVIRPVAQAPISTPLEWSEVTADLEPARLNVRSIFRRLKEQKRDPMASLLKQDRSASQRSHG
jgi:bifunctional non-homologous end joining protein LigD